MQQVKMFYRGYAATLPIDEQINTYLSKNNDESYYLVIDHIAFAHIYIAAETFYESALVVFRQVDRAGSIRTMPDTMQKPVETEPINSPRHCALRGGI